MMTWLSAGMVFTLASVVLVLILFGNRRFSGTHPVSLLTFVAILFTSGLDVGLIMFPLTEFAGYADLQQNPEYGFSNPLAIEFGYWGFLVWAIYFLTCFYFCALEPRLGFFKLPLIKLLNNLVIIGTCAFTAHLLLVNLDWYLPKLAVEQGIATTFYAIVFATIGLAVYSSTKLVYVKILSLGTSLLFFALILMMGLNSSLQHDVSVFAWLNSMGLLSEYFAQLHEFVLPLNSYHAFYLFWWFAWSIMIGQFTARFVGNLKTYQIFLAMLFLPSVPIAIWFSVLHLYHVRDLATDGLINLAMVFVGVTFVLNSLDSLVRLYSDNLNLSVAKLGFWPYWALHSLLLAGLTLLFNYGFMRIQWVGALVIGLFFCCFAYIVWQRVSARPAQPE